MGKILDTLLEKRHTKKMLAVLLDPDRCQISRLDHNLLDQVDMILIGSSILTENHTDELCREIKSRCQTPTVLFPGNSYQVCDTAHGILFTSLISGRNPDFLISQQVLGAPLVKAAGLETIPTGYLMIESGVLTAATYMTQTVPIPRDKPEIAATTAMAGEMLGQKVIYLEAGSGARLPVPEEMIRSVRTAVEGLLIVGGGIRTTEQAEKAWFAGADLVVIGSIIEQQPEILQDFIISKETHRVKK